TDAIALPGMAAFEKSVPDESVPDSQQMPIPVWRSARPFEFQLLRIPPARLGKMPGVEVHLNGQAAGRDAVVVDVDVDPLAFFSELPVERLGHKGIRLALSESS